MDVFDLRARLVDDYARYTRSFIKIADRRIQAKVDQALEDGVLWPEPLLQLNPTFSPGGAIDDLVASDVLHPECARIFRIDKTETDHTGVQLLLHAHQREAILKAGEGASYVLTSGTGSGKSLAYIVPIVNHVLRSGSGRGIQAIVVYPMNALANSQDEELRKFLERGYPEGGSPVTFARYTGQEKKPVREAIRRRPPDILLTNYMMLELLLTRREDRALVRAAQGLRFLVFDELHTYRGRQGADVALLIRRCRLAFEGHRIICVGTSATLSSTGTADHRRSSRNSTSATDPRNLFPPPPAMRREPPRFRKPCSKSCWSTLWCIATTWSAPPSGYSSSTISQPELLAAFAKSQRKAEGESHLLRNSGRYPLCGRGDINVYTVFAESMRGLLADAGRAGIIVPSGIATDDTTKFFFQDLMDSGNLASLFDFENKGIFPGVHSSYKFCLLTLRGADRQTAGGPTARAEFAFFIHTIEDLRAPDRRFTLSAEDIALLNPNTRTCPIFRTRADAELTKGIYRRVSVLEKMMDPPSSC